MNQKVVMFKNFEKFGVLTDCKLFELITIDKCKPNSETFYPEMTRNRYFENYE